MNTVSQRMLNVLFVKCVRDESSFSIPEPSEGVSYHLVDSAEQARLEMERITLDCVLALFDPGNRDSIKALEAIQSAASEHGLQVAGLSTFNPHWIENLMSQLGVDQHFKTIPTDAEVGAFVQKQIAPPSEKKKAVGDDV